MKEETLTPPHLRLFQGAFSPSAPTLRPARIVGFDTEDDTRGLPLSFAFHDGVESFYTKHADEALDYIFNYPTRAVFCAHNLEYDIGNLFKASDFRLVKEMVYASKLLKVTLFGSHHYFLNTSSFFAGSLAKMGAIVGLPKLEGDSLNREYAIRDAQIVQVFTSKLQDRLLAQGVNLGLSIGQLAVAVYRANFIKAKQVTFNSPNCLKAYYGGRVEMFYKGVVKGPVYVADINSSYPDVMRRHEYPDTSLVESSSIFSHRFGVGRFRIRVPESCFIPPLPYRSDSGRLFFPTGEVEGWWTYAEVRFAVERCGCTILAEYEGEGCNRALRPFTDFIDTMYEQRQVMKRRKALNPDDAEAAFEDLYLKLLMNNLYGKFAQHKDGSKMTRTKIPARELEKMQGAIETMIGPFYAYRIPKQKPPKTANYLWGVYVTSYARLSLLEKIMAVHQAGGQILYCDTDSVMFTGEKAKTVLTFGDSLGQMSLETYDLGVYRASKGYLLCKQRSNRLVDKAREYQVEKVACKGVPTHYAHDFILKGMASFLKPMRLKEAEVRLHAAANKKKDEFFFKDIGINVWREVEKSMRSIYIKRKGERGVTLPVDVNEIPAMEEKAWGAPESWEAELGAEVVLPPSKKKDTFRSVKVPDSWFAEAYQREIGEILHDGQHVQFLKREDCLQLKKGDAWFVGDLIDLRRGQFGRFYLIMLKKYMGQNVARKNIVVAMSEKFFFRFGRDFAYLKKRVEFSLASDYTLNASLELSAKILHT